MNLLLPKGIGLFFFKEFPEELTYNNNICYFTIICASAQ